VARSAASGPRSCTGHIAAGVAQEGTGFLLTRSGFGSLVLVNGHGGNYVLSNLVQEASAAGRRMALFPGREDWKKARLDAALETTDHEDMHAGELETSVLLH
jgi:creatinine amidohydrolase